MGCDAIVSVAQGQGWRPGLGERRLAQGPASPGALGTRSSSLKAQTASCSRHHCCYLHRQSAPLEAARQAGDGQRCAPLVSGPVGRLCRMGAAICSLAACLESATLPPFLSSSDRPWEVRPPASQPVSRPLGWLGPCWVHAGNAIDTSAPAAGQGTEATYQLVVVELLVSHACRSGPK